MKSSPLFGLRMLAAFGSKQIIEKMLQSVLELASCHILLMLIIVQVCWCTFHAHFSGGKIRRNETEDEPLSCF